MPPLTMLQPAAQLVLHIRVTWSKPSDQTLPRPCAKARRESWELAVGEGGFEEASHSSMCTQRRSSKTQGCQQEG